MTTAISVTPSSPTARTPPLGPQLARLGGAGEAPRRSARRPADRLRRRLDHLPRPSARHAAHARDADTARRRPASARFRLDIARVEQQWGIDFGEYFAEDLERLRELKRDELVTIDARWIAATPAGELFVRNLAQCFDRYWRERHETSGRPTFSRTI